MHDRKQQQHGPGDSQQDAERHGHCAANTKIWTNGVTLNWLTGRKPARSQHRLQLAQEWKCRKPGPKARKLAASRTCSANTTRPPLRKQRFASANHAARSVSVLNSWMASRENTTSADLGARGQAS